MIFRLLVLCLAGAGAYVLLKGRPEEMPVLLRACLAVLLLVGGLGWWAARGKAADIAVVKGGRKPGLTDFLAIGTGVLALECGFLWLLSAAPRPLEDAAIVIEAKFLPAAAAKRSEVDDAGNVSGNWLWDEARQRALPRRTNLKPGAKPEVFVRLPKKEDAEALLKNQVYVRAFALDDYRNGIWSMVEVVARDLKAGEDGWIQLGQDKGEGILHEVFHGRSAGGRDVLTALQGVEAVRMEDLRTVGDGMAFLPDISGPSGFEYLASSVPVTLEDLGNAEAAGSLVVGKAKGRFGRLAMKAAGEGELLDRLKNIQLFLRDGFGYSLKTENSRNLDPLENFLYEEKRGHCEFFATAGALMARELGVESRVAYGWAGGQYFKESQMFVFREREAHAWVEVNLKGHGWVVMEPTPPVVLSGGGTPRVAGAGDSLPNPDEDFTDEYGDGVAAGNAHVEKVALGLMGVFGVVACGMLLMRGKKEAHGFAGIGLRTEEKGGYFRAWQDSFRKRVKGTERGLTLGKQLETLDEKPEFGEELLSYHYGVRYEEKLPDTESEGRLLKKIRDWE